MLFTGSKASEPPAEKKRPYCPWRSRLPEYVKPDCCLTGLSSTIRTQAYLEKRLGADFYKVPRATAVRILSAVRKSIVWILRLFSERQHQNEQENQALCAPMLGTQLHTQKCLYRSQKCSREMRFTRGLLQSIDRSIWFCLAL